MTSPAGVAHAAPTSMISIDSGGGWFLGPAVASKSITSTICPCARLARRAFPVREGQGQQKHSPNFARTSAPSANAVQAVRPRPLVPRTGHPTVASPKPTHKALHRRCEAQRLPRSAAVNWSRHGWGISASTTRPASLSVNRHSGQQLPLTRNIGHVWHAPASAQEAGAVGIPGVPRRRGRRCRFADGEAARWCWPRFRGATRSPRRYRGALRLASTV